MNLQLPFFMRRLLLRRVLKSFGLVAELYPEEYAKSWDIMSKLRIKWDPCNQGYRKILNGKIWYLRLNEKADEPRYTLHIDQEAIVSFNNLPKKWQLKNKL